MAFDSQHRVWTPLFNFNGQRNSVPFPLTPAAPSTALAAVGVQVTWPDAHVYRYRVYRDGALIATLAGQSYNDTAVASGTHDYTISVGLADQVTWSPQSPASTISLSADSLVFRQPPDYTISIGTQSIDLSQFVSGGNAQKWFGKISGTFPKDVDIGLTTGVVGTEFRETGSFPLIIRVVDTKEEALIMDWAARSTGPGVKWAHDFRDNATVTKFRIKAPGGVTQTDGAGEQLVRRNATDGVKGNGCLELMTPTGMHNGMRWARPFCTLPGDRGYVSGDPLLPDWASNQYQFRRGMYGHPDYWSQSGPGSPYGNTPGVDDGSNWQGHDFYLQFRQKIDPNLYSPLNNPDYAGKQSYIEICGGGNQEIILQNQITTKRFSMYTNFGRNGGRIGEPPGQAYNIVQTNTPFASPGPDYANVWQWPVGEWVTILLHIIPGHHNGDSNDWTFGSTSLTRDTGIEVWVARYGATSYTKIWEQFNLNWSFSAQSPAYGDLYGFNCFLASQYMNGPATGTPAGIDWYMRYDEFVFGDRPIACPQVYA